MKQAMNQSRFAVILWVMCIKKAGLFILPILYINANFMLFATRH